VRRAVAALALAAACVAGAPAAIAQVGPPLPTLVTAELPSLKRLGEGRLRFLGIHVYDSSLWVTGPFGFDRPFALDIRYAMNVKGRDLSERSIKEMKGLGFTDPEKLARWEKAMDRVFPDIKPGDRLVGIHVPGKEARFYSNDRLLGSVADPEFARAFFGIWLDEKTSEPKLRSKLLGQD
jgi:Chalcone isomerase-like